MMMMMVMVLVIVMVMIIIITIDIIKQALKVITEEVIMGVMISEIVNNDK